MLLLGFASLSAVASGSGSRRSALGDAVALLQQPVQAHHEELSLEDRLRSQGRHRPVFFVHVHKAGGTAICLLANNNGEKFMSAADQKSCNQLFLDDYHAWYQTSYEDCSRRRMQYLASGFTWAMIERPFMTEEYCPESFFYSTMIRHPVELALAKVNFLDDRPKEQWHGYRWKTIVPCLEKRQAGDWAACPKEVFYNSVNEHWVYFDNFLVRLFGGLDVWSLPPGAINATHRELAFQSLKGFDMVLTLEQFSSNATRQKFREAFGWQHLEAIDLHVRRRPEQLTSFGEEDLVRIRRLIRHDLILWDDLKAHGVIDA